MVLTYFEAVTGLKVNQSKSEMVPSGTRFRIGQNLQIPSDVRLGVYQRITLVCLWGRPSSQSRFEILL